MKVTVMMPTFNRCAMFHDALMSAFSQDHQDLEILVHDNGTTDGTKEYLSKIGDSRVKVIRTDQNIRDPNILVKNATGELLCWLHDDDEFYGTDSISSRVMEFERDKKIEVLYASAENVYQNGNFHSFTYAEAPDKNRIRRCEYTHWPTYMWKKSVHERIGYFPMTMKYQHDRWFKVVTMHECKCFALEKVVIKYRIWGGQDSAVSRHSGEIIKDSEECERLLKERYG